jgi:hypothetical protein
VDIWKLFAATWRFAVVLTELPDNPGTSVTNCVQQLATQLLPQVAQFSRPDPIDPRAILWLEHYDRSPQNSFPETWDLVHLDWDGARYHSPRWQPWP